MQKIYIITPTYNRAEYLPALYGSLCAQSDPDFGWIIVDDGSTDDTRTTVEGFQGENRISLTYLRKENGGKHTALNLALQHCDADLVFIVDSDDTLPPDAVAIIRSYAAKYEARRHELNLCGFSFLRAYPDGKINDAMFPVDECVDTYCSQRINGGIAGDKAEVFYGDILKAHPFQTFPHERFMPEDALWMELSGPYRMVHINKVIYISEYLTGGLTKTGRNMKIWSPFGMMYRSCVYLNDGQVNLRTRVKMQLLYHVYHHFALEEAKDGRYTQKEFQQSEARCRCPHNFLYYAAVCPGWVIYRKWRKTYQKNG